MILSFWMQILMARRNSKSEKVMEIWQKQGIIIMTS